MSKRQSTFAIGILLLIMPFLGFPTFIKDILYIVSGIFVIHSAYKMKIDSNTQVDTFKETIVDSPLIQNSKENLQANINKEASADV